MGSPLEAATASESARFVRAATKPLQELTEDGGSRAAKVERDVLTTSVVASTARAAERARARGVALHATMRSTHYFA